MYINIEELPSRELTFYEFFGVGGSEGKNFHLCFLCIFPMLIQLQKVSSICIYTLPGTHALTHTYTHKYIYM